MTQVDGVEKVDRPTGMRKFRLTLTTDQGVVIDHWSWIHGATEAEELELGLSEDSWPPSEEDIAQAIVKFTRVD